MIAATAHSPVGDWRMRRRRGVALLLVLATLVLVSTAIASVARLASLGALQQEMQGDERLALDLLNAAEAPILRWLNLDSHRVILAQDTQTPEVPVLNDRFIVADTAWSLRVTAWDQCGMVPGLEHAERWRDALLGDLLALMRRVQPDAQQANSRTIEPLGKMASDARLSVTDRARLLPTPAHQAARPFEFGNSNAAAPARTDRPASISALLSIGARVATRVEALDARGDRAAWSTINVHTAPRAVLAAAFKQVGRRGLDAVLAARAAGRAVTLPNLGERHEGSGIEFVTASPVWSFRIDAEVGIASRSWWVVYARMDGHWQLVQRWAIPV